MSDATDTAIAQLQQDVAALTDAEGKAVTLLNGLATQLAAAIAAASNSGATPTQLSELNDLHAAITTATSGLVQAVATDTPAAPPPPPPPTITIDEVNTITGTAPFTVSGSLAAEGGESPYAFTFTGDVPGVTFNADGTYSGLITDAFTGSTSAVATDANGVASAPASIGFSIAAAAPPPPPTGDDVIQPED